MELIALSRAELRELVPKVVRHGGLADDVIADLEAVDVRLVQLVRRVVSRRRPVVELDFRRLDLEMRCNRSLCG